MSTLKLVIKQNKPPLTRFYVSFGGLQVAFNDFSQIKEWLHDLQINQLEPYVDLSEDNLSYEIDHEYMKLRLN